MSRCYVTARVTAKPGLGPALQAEMERNIPLVRAEQGCLRYDLLTLSGQPDVFLYTEVWEDEAALKAHAASPHMAAYRERTRELTEGPSIVEIWSAANVAG